VQRVCELATIDRYRERDDMVVIRCDTNLSLACQDVVGVAAISSVSLLEVESTLSEEKREEEGKSTWRDGIQLQDSLPFEVVTGEIPIPHIERDCIRIRGPGVDS